MSVVTIIFSKEKCTVSHSRAHQLPLLHLCVSGIRLPVVLDCSTDFPSTFPPSFHKLIAKFETNYSKCLQYSHPLWPSLNMFYTASLRQF